MHWPVTDDYTFEKRLGEGCYGQVWEATEKATGTVVAVKVVAAITVKDVERFEREIKVFERLSSPYVVRLHCIFQDARWLYLVMDMCKGGDLMQYLMDYWEDEQFPERQKFALEHPDEVLALSQRELGSLIWQMLAGVSYLHFHRFAHRDIKLENYMLKDKDPDPQLQLCDFGLSIRLQKGHKVTGKVGTALYMAPEVLAGGWYDTACDIWSLGITAYIMSTSSLPFKNTDPSNAKGHVVSNSREPWPKTLPPLPKELKELIDRMLTWNAAARPSAKELLAKSIWLQRNGRGGEMTGAPPPSKCAIS